MRSHEGERAVFIQEFLAWLLEKKKKKLSDMWSSLVLAVYPLQRIPTNNESFNLILSESLQFCSVVFYF